MGFLSDFDRVSAFYDKLPIPTHPEALRARLDGVEGPRVDLGGGTGRFTVEVHGEAGALVVDPSAGMLAEARERGLDGVRGVGEALPVAEESLGAVTVTEAFHHFTPRQGEVLDEIARALHDEGALIVEEIDPSRVLGRMIALGEWVLGFDSAFLTPDELVDLLHARFESVAVTRTGWFTYLVDARGPEVG